MNLPTDGRACARARRRNVSCTIVRFDGIIKPVSNVENSPQNVCKIASLLEVYLQSVCFHLFFYIFFIIIALVFSAFGIQLFFLNLKI